MWNMVLRETQYVPKITFLIKNHKCGGNNRRR
jgi:hypothetical protein